MEDLRDQFDGVRGLDALSCGFHMFDFQPSNKNALRSSCGIVCIFCAEVWGIIGRPVPSFCAPTARTHRNPSNK